MSSLFFPRAWRRWLPVAAITLLISLPAEATTLRTVMHSALRTLDPVASSATIVRNHGYMVFDTLLGVDDQLEPRPQMADWQVSDDGLTYTFTLRPDLKWHDGTPVTAADCIASIKRWASYDAGGRVMMTKVAALTPLDDQSFELRLDTPFGEVLNLLAKPSAVPAFMMPERLASTPFGEMIPEQIGSGPFRFVADEFQPGVKVVYEKFDDYVPRSEPANGTAGGKQVNVDRVEWINMPDAQTAINALLSGDVDYIERAPIDLLMLLENQDGIHTEVLDRLGMQIEARMNFLHPPFDDVRIRRAALLAIGQQDVLDALIGDPRYYQACAAVFGCGTPYASESGGETLLSGGDIEGARQLLEEAGYDGTPVVILQPTDVATLAPQPVVVADALRRAGFNVQLEPMDWQTVVSRRASQAAPAQGGWNLFITNSNIDSIWNPLINSLLTAGGSESSWFGWPTDPELEQLRADFASAEDEADRVDISERVQRHALDQVIYVPLGQFRNVAAWRGALDNVLSGPVTAFWQLDKQED
ncbi:ABC transporter substrate-binding protein [Halotalea alkalilenta]|uniref:ABC transporter substrate-binding protein n=1 Tax=Halotalea alkalilenta TaxID=376489 RepID=UPI0005B8AC4B|nr:ABC transporter substrate-binding protein [Halotalea alkalilenta]